MGRARVSLPGTMPSHGTMPSMDTGGDRRPDAPRRPGRKPRDRRWDGRSAFTGALVGLVLGGLITLVTLVTGSTGPDTSTGALVAGTPPPTTGPIDPAPPSPATAPPTPTPAPPTPAAATPDPTRGADGLFGPVITDRIPPPAEDIPFEAPVIGMTNMQPPARAAFTAAFEAAREAGLAPTVKTAWRSERWQQVLLDRAVARHGSLEEATKWVLPPVRSAHVRGHAVDVHPESAARWLREHGAAYGICWRFANEWWHFEYLATSQCPPVEPSATVHGP